MFLRPLPLGPSACVHLNPGLLPPPFVHSPHSPLTICSEPAGGWGAIQYYFHFRPGIEKVALDHLQPELHQLPMDFSTSLLGYENWAAPNIFSRCCPLLNLNRLMFSPSPAHVLQPTPPRIMDSPFVTVPPSLNKPPAMDPRWLSRTITTTIQSPQASGPLTNATHQTAALSHSLFI